MTKYLLSIDYHGGVIETPMEEWKPEDVKAHRRCAHREPARAALPHRARGNALARRTGGCDAGGS